MSQPSLVPAVAKKEERGRAHSYDVRTEEGVQVSKISLSMSVKVCQNSAHDAERDK